MNNFYAFKKFLEERDLPFMEDTLNDEKVILISETTKKGFALRVFIQFTNDDRLVGLYVFNFAILLDRTDKDALLDILNELNCKYSYFKFAIDQNDEIVISNNQTYLENFSPELLFSVLLDCFLVIDEEGNLVRQAMFDGEYLDHNDIMQNIMESISDFKDKNDMGIWGSDDRKLMMNNLTEYIKHKKQYLEILETRQRKNPGSLDEI